MIQEELPFELTGGGDCTLHFHTVDRAPTHDTLLRLQDLCNHVTVSSNYTARYEDDLIMVELGATVTLPLSIRGKEFEVVAMDDTAFSILFSGADTLYGDTSVLVEVAMTALRFKSITGGWVLI